MCGFSADFCQQKMRQQAHVGALLFSTAVLLAVVNARVPIIDMLRGHMPRMRTIKGDGTGNDGDIGELTTQDTFRPYRASSQNANLATGRGDPCELEVVNELDEPVLLCWVTQAGELKHYRPINDKSIKDKSVSNVHVEYTYVGDQFVCIRNLDPLPKVLKDIRKESFVFSYIPRCEGVKHTLLLSKYNKRRRLFSLRGSSLPAVKVELSCVPIAEAGEIIDSSNKVYEPRELCGFTVHCEPGVFDVPGFESTIVADIAQLSCLLPDGACARLQADTHIYINKSLTYGTTKKPIVAKGCCYHPRGGADWLRNNGLNVCKEGCVEIFSAESYLQSRDHWGTGGVLVHEFSHVYHDKHCQDGYDCEDIRNAYNVAMKAKLYDSVYVHGPQGVAADGTRTTAKAYACTNCMEFFAELSVAYHYSLDEEEYNKWFPHNRMQLIKHDPASYAVLDRIWRQYE